MQKNKIIILSLMTILIGITLFITLDTKDSEKFKKEYENLNNQKTEGKENIKVKIDANNQIEYANYNKVFKTLNTTGIIYFGFPECPWCRNIVPILLEAAKESNVSKIYYMNNKEDRDIKELKNDKIKVTKKGTENYQKLLKKLGDKADTYEGLNNTKIKRLYFPTVITVKNGKITNYISGTVESQKDPYKPLNKDQKKELKNKYLKAFNSLNACDQNEKC